ncbi:MAG TPA: sn-glycerol-3-phosphate ABC transporter ATP-binding protein UgpC [Candidatus Binatia bacterium]|nr:sn-glycerol-3-phosphate ABC transporter ATP-binding protein UgpC [Candidatus Binatia bacterium]
MATVGLEHVDKVYPGGTRALVDCTLALEDAELIVIVGPSGCGKSTLLRLVAGLESPSAGTLRIGDRVVNDLRPQERNVAMVFQDYALYPYLTARGNLEFPLKMRRLRRDEVRSRVDAVARLLDITGLLDRLPKELSGGQRQRVAMGRALVREPAVFLLDEPLSNLDAKLRVQVRAEIKELQGRTRTTMMYVTHDQVEAMTLADRVVVLDRGPVQQVAPPRELYDRPANAFVAGFIGNPPMNLFPARLVLAGAAIELGGKTVPIAPAGISLDRLRAHADTALTAGIRPEAIRLSSSGGAIPATLEHVESLGHETLAHVTVAGDVRLVARVDGMPPLAKGETVGVELDPTRVHLFDPEGRSLLAPE